MKMAKLHQLAFVVLVIQICASAAPSDISKLEDIAKIERAEELNDELTSSSLLDDVTQDHNATTKGQRQKRWYNFYGYGFPPMNPIIYPNYIKRDESPNTAGYGYEDPISLIYRRLLEISNNGRQQSLPPVQPPHNQFPIFFPVIYIPQVGCGCAPQNPSTPDTPDNNATSPEISNRFPEMEDTRQNWGFLINETESIEDEEEFSRPITFDPIPPRRNISRRPPPVEHGSSQGDVNSQGVPQSSSSNRPLPPSPPREPPPPPNASLMPNMPPPPPSTAPSACDAAILSCCHQPKVTYDCFVSQGCPDTTSYGNPCAANVILKVVERFQDYYTQRTG